MRIEEELYKELIDKMNTYHPTKEFDMIEKAYRLAVEAHKDQKRKSGEPYIYSSLKSCLYIGRTGIRQRKYYSRDST